MEALYVEAISEGKKTLSILDDYLTNNKNTIDVLNSFQLQEFKTELQKNVTKLEINKFNLIFMGKSGKGKTTCISSILDMYYCDEQDNIQQVMPSDEGGHTTCCLIEINILDEENTNYINVEVNSKESVKEILENYCKSKNNLNDTSSNISEEYIEIIEAKLDENDIEYIETRMNEVSNNVSQEDENCNICLKYLIDKLNINDYNQENRKIVISAQNKNEIFKEIGNRIFKINYGQTDEFYIPQKISLFIDRKLLNIPEYINKIIDTRGISGNERLNSRTDLKELINQDNNIVVYINEYTILDQFVKEFYNAKLKTLATTSDELIRFNVLINAFNTSVKSKAKNGKTVESVKKEKIRKFRDDVKPFTQDGEEMDDRVREEIKNNFNKLKSYAKKVDADIYNFKIYTPLQGMRKLDESIEVIDDTMRNNNINDIYDYFELIYKKRNDLILEYIYHFKSLIEKCINGKLGISNEAIITKYINDFQNDIKKYAVKCIKEDYLKNYLKKLLKELYKVNANTIACVAKNGGYRKRDDATVWELTNDYNEERVENVKTLLQQTSIIKTDNLMKDIQLYYSNEDKLHDLKEAVQSFYLRYNNEIINEWHKKVEDEIRNIFYIDSYELEVWKKTIETRNEDNITYLSALKVVMDKLTTITDTNEKKIYELDKYLLPLSN